MRKLNFSKSKTVSITIWTILFAIIAMLATDLDIFIKLDGGDSGTISSARGTGEPYQIDIYYFPKRKNSADALTGYFRHKGYLVNNLTAKELENSQATKYSPSHFFFNKEDFGLAMEIKSKMEQVLGYPISGYKFRAPQHIPSMIVVFTDAEIEGAGEHAAADHSHE